MKWIRVSIVVTALGLLVVTGAVLSQAFPSSEAVRLRNSLLLMPPDLDAGVWTPDDIPAEFLLEHAAVPPAIAAAAARIRAGSAATDVDLGRALASHLIRRLDHGGRIATLNIERIYREIVEQGRGYCAGVVEAFTALALAAGLHVRQWAFSFDGFGGHGHVVAEVFDRRDRRWVMLDVYNNVMAVDADSGEPLSARQFMQSFRRNVDVVSFRRIGVGRLGFEHEHKLVDYYTSGIDHWYLWNGNNVVSRYAGSALVRFGDRIGQPVAQLIAIALGLYPGIVAVPNERNVAHIETMDVLRSWLLLAAGLGVALTVLLVVEFGLLLALRRAQGPRTASSAH